MAAAPGKLDWHRVVLGPGGQLPRGMRITQDDSTQTAPEPDYEDSLHLADNGRPRGSRSRHRRADVAATADGQSRVQHRRHDCRHRERRADEARERSPPASRKSKPLPNAGDRSDSDSESERESRARSSRGHRHDELKRHHMTKMVDGAELCAASPGWRTHGNGHEFDDDAKDRPRRRRRDHRDSDDSAPNRGRGVGHRRGDRLADVAPAQLQFDAAHVDARGVRPPGRDAPSAFPSRHRNSRGLDDPQQAKSGDTPGVCVGASPCANSAAGAEAQLAAPLEGNAVATRQRHPSGGRRPAGACRIIWSIAAPCGAAPELGGRRVACCSALRGRSRTMSSDESEPDSGDVFDAALAPHVAYVRRVFNAAAAEASLAAGSGSVPLSPAGPMLFGGALSGRAGARPLAERHSGSRMKAANNFLKSLLFSRYVPRRSKIADWGCNHGQDMAKLEYVRPRCVVFVDVAETGLHEAERRWSRAGAATFDAAFVHADFCRADFLAGLAVACSPHPSSPVASPQSCASGRADLCDSSTGDASGGATGLVASRASCLSFDAVSCHFAAHHAFYSAESADVFLGNVSRALRDGGVFVGTAPAGEAIMRLIVAAERSGGNGRHRCGPVALWRDRAALAAPFGIANTSGLPYRFGLADPASPGLGSPSGEEGGVLEFTMTTPDLTMLCARHGLRRIFCAPLGAFYRDESINPKNEELARRMGLRADPPTDDDVRNMDIYVAFVFVKAGPATAPAAHTPPEPSLAMSQEDTHTPTATPPSRQTALPPDAPSAANGPGRPFSGADGALANKHSGAESDTVLDPTATTTTTTTKATPTLARGANTAPASPKRECNLRLLVDEGPFRSSESVPSAQSIAAGPSASLMFPPKHDKDASGSPNDGAAPAGQVDSAVDAAVVVTLAIAGDANADGKPDDSGSAQRQEPCNVGAHGRGGDCDGEGAHRTTEEAGDGEPDASESSATSRRVGYANAPSGATPAACLTATGDAAAVLDTHGFLVVNSNAIQETDGVPSAATPQC